MIHCASSLCQLIEIRLRIMSLVIALATFDLEFNCHSKNSVACEIKESLIVVGVINHSS